MRVALLLFVGWLAIAANPAAAAEEDFLYLPPIAGAVDRPGYAGLIPLSSFTGLNTDGGPGFAELTRPVDGTTPALHLAVLKGTEFPLADILVYDDASGPSRIFEMSNVVVAADVVTEGNIARETVLLDYASLQAIDPGPPPPAVPEPASATLMGAALLALGLRARRRAARH